MSKGTCDVVQQIIPKAPDGCVWSIALPIVQWHRAGADPSRGVLLQGLALKEFVAVAMRMKIHSAKFKDGLDC